MVNLMCSIPIKYIWPCLIIGVIKFSVIQRMFKEYYVIYIILTLGSEPDFFYGSDGKKYMDLGPSTLDEQDIRPVGYLDRISGCAL